MNTHNIVKQQGFTLIELMVTVAIIAILSATAVSSYQTYTIRAQASEGITLASGAKVVITEYQAQYGQWPDMTQMSQADFLSFSGKYIQKTEIGENGTIIAIFGNDANNKITGKTVLLIPTIETPGNISWKCQSTVDDVYLPSSCSHIEN